MPQQRRLTRIALELEESDYDEMQSILKEYNAAFAPMKLSRSALLRSALQGKVGAAAAAAGQEQGVSLR